MKAIASMGAAAALAALAACSGGGEPKGSDIREALILPTLSIVGDSPKARADAREAIGEVKVVGCKKAEQGGYRCSWTAAMGGGTGRFVNDNGVWKLAAAGEG